MLAASIVHKPRINPAGFCYPENMRHTRRQSVPMWRGFTDERPLLDRRTSAIRSEDRRVWVDRARSINAGDLLLSVFVGHSPNIIACRLGRESGHPDDADQLALSGQVLPLGIAAGISRSRSFALAPRVSDGARRDVWRRPPIKEASRFHAVRL